MSNRFSFTDRHINNNYSFSKHASDRMAQRQIKKDEVFLTLKSGVQPSEWHGGPIPFTRVISPAMAVEMVVIVNPWTGVIITVFWQPAATKFGACTKQSIKEEISCVAMNGM